MVLFPFDFFYEKYLKNELTSFFCFFNFQKSPTKSNIFLGTLAAPQANLFKYERSTPALQYVTRAAAWPTKRPRGCWTCWAASRLGPRLYGDELVAVPRKMEWHSKDQDLLTFTKMR